MTMTMTKQPLEHAGTPRAATAEYTWCVGIRAKYLGPTNNRGSRVRAWRADTTYAGDPDAITVSYDHALGGSDNAVAAINAYLAQKSEGWSGRWVVAGADDSSYIAVRAQR